MKIRLIRWLLKVLVPAGKYQLIQTSLTHYIEFREDHGITHIRCMDYDNYKEDTNDLKDIRRLFDDTY